MIRQQAFVSAKKMLKGGLHCHTTRSDGAGTPEDVIRYHYGHGYDFLALTDHRFYNFKSHAPDVPLTVIPGMEFDNEISHGNGFRTFHTVCIGPSKEDGNGFEQDERFESGKAKNQDEFQAYLDEFHNKNNLTFYCHPQWSSTPARYFDRQKGHFAMEVWNSGCALSCDMDRDAAYWDELLGQGVKIYGVATDDGHAMRHHCNGWVMVNAENDINSILSALKEGKFYASCGPVIKDFYVDKGVAVVECEKAAKVRFHSDRHPTRIIAKPEGITRAEYNLESSWEGGYKYVRAVVCDFEGRLAWTNPIWLD